MGNSRVNAKSQNEIRKEKYKKLAKAQRAERRRSGPPVDLNHGWGTEPPVRLVTAGERLPVPVDPLRAFVRTLPWFKSVRCKRCDDTRLIASDFEGASWGSWLALPEDAKSAVVLGIVYPVPCPACAR